jgi:spermidine/putrescine transport system ATP-binding protein
VANLLPATVLHANGREAVVTLAGDRTVPVSTGEWALPAGSAATVMVRPERLRLSEAAPATGASVPLTLQHAIFQGPVVRCTLRAADGTDVVAHIGPEQSLPSLHPGLILWASWDMDAARVLPPAGHPAAVDTDLRTTVERATMPMPRHGPPHP